MKTTQAIDIKTFKDGNTWCALIDDNPRMEFCGFGITPVDAIRNLCDDIEKESMVLNYENTE